MLLTDTIISGSIGVVISVITWYLERKNQALADKKTVKTNCEYVNISAGSACGRPI